MIESIYNFQVEYEKNEIKEFERNILSQEICESFIPTSFIGEENKLIAIYKYDGYLKISQCRFREITQLLNLMEYLLKELLASADYFMDYSRIKLSCDTVFYSSLTEKIKVAYIPENKLLYFNVKLIKFIEELKENFTNRSSEYLDKLIRYIRENNYSIPDICNKISELKREVYLYGIK